MKNKISGFVRIPILLGLLIGVIILGGISYFLIKSEKQSQQLQNELTAIKNSQQSITTSTATTVKQQNNSSVISQSNTTELLQVKEYGNYFKQRTDLLTKLETIANSVGGNGNPSQQTIDEQNQKSIDASNLSLELTKLEIPKLPDSLANVLVKDKILVGQYADDISQTAKWMGLFDKAIFDDANNGVSPISNTSEESQYMRNVPSKFSNPSKLFNADLDDISNNMEYINSAFTNNFGSN
jgi:preprotein translocase subunit YajC